MSESNLEKLLKCSDRIHNELVPRDCVKIISKYVCDINELDTDQARRFLQNIPSDVVLKELINAGLDINSLILHTSLIRRFDKEFAFRLINAADIDALDENKTLIESINIRDDNVRNDVIFELIRKGVDLDIQGKHGDTPLMHAVYFSYYEIVQALLENGADPHIEDNRGRTALSVAQARGNQRMLNILEPYTDPRHA